MRFRLMCCVAAVPLSLVGGLAAQTMSPGVSATPDAREAEIRELRAEVERISARLAQLEAEGHAGSASAAPAPAEGKEPASVSAASASAATSSVSAATTTVAPGPVLTSGPVLTRGPVLTPADAATVAFFRGTTVAVGIDGYYGYNFNEPSWCE